MKITLTMTAEEYDLYRAYQKDKENLERAIGATERHLREVHENLCAAVLSAFEVQNSILYADGVPAISAPAVVVKDQTAAENALALAADWYA